MSTRWLSDLVGTLADYFSVKWLKFRPSSAPGSPVDGEVYYDSTVKRLESYDGSAWHKYLVDITVQTAKTSNYTFALADIDTCVPYNSSSTGTFTVPSSITLTFPIGAELFARQAGSGVLHVQAASGAALAPGAATTALQGEWVRLRQITLDNWDVCIFTSDQLRASSNLSDLQSASTARTNLGVPAGSGTSTGTNTGDQTNITGNAGTATALQTARNIDGQAFDGTANITVIAPGTHAATAKTTPAANDEFPLADSAASYALKKIKYSDLAAAIGGGGGSGGNYTKIAQVVCAGSQTTITFSSIPGTYTDLQLVLTGSLAAGASVQTLYMKFNGAGSGTYRSTAYEGGNGSSNFTGALAPSAGGAAAGGLSGTGSTASPISTHDIRIFSYKATSSVFTFKNFVSYLSGDIVGNFQAVRYAGAWNSDLGTGPTAINQIDLATGGGSAFADGTVATLYGIG